ncbi:hypothetical protein BC834DRAFT_1042584 [Gloeopeniophorella convolvens]|nr:hypothetical protein BC834DRAFT_1042584 [Gloeopeniophorella convolvens]
MDLVLVTGATGFVGSHIVDHVLRVGYRVRAIARSGKSATLRSAYAFYGNTLEIAEIADLATSDLTAAFEGVDALIHVGSPLPGTESPEIMVRNTVEATKRVLDYARHAGIKKIIATGTFGNVLHPDDAYITKTFSEDDWNPQTLEDAKKPGTHPWAVYTAAKVSAERAVWEFAGANKDIDITTILPGFVFGPLGCGQSVDAAPGGTFNWVRALITGEKGRPLLANSPPFSPNYVHVWDVATLHVAALKAAPAPGMQRRALAVAGTVLWPQVSEYLAKSHPQLKDRVGVVPEDYVAPATIAIFENRNAAALGLSSFKGWVEAFDDAADALLSLEVLLGVRS